MVFDDAVPTDGSEVDVIVAPMGAINADVDAVLGFDLEIKSGTEKDIKLRGVAGLFLGMVRPAVKGLLYVVVVPDDAVLRNDRSLGSLRAGMTPSLSKHEDEGKVKNTDIPK
jgi:hypothetical protein